jgi:lipopolysaccharide export system permease protein
MRTVRRLFYVDIVSAVVFVALAFLALFFFIDFVDELRDVGTRGYSVRPRRALLAAARAGASLRADADRRPDRHDLRARAARAVVAVHDPAHQRPRPRAGRSGSSPASRSRSAPSPSSSATTSRRSAPASAASCAPLQRQPQARPLGRLDQGALVGPDGERSYSINVGSAERGTLLRDVRIFEFDGDGQLLSRTAAVQAVVDRDGTWTMSDVVTTRWADDGAAPTAREERTARRQWRSSLSPDVVAAAVLPVTTMSTIELWRYIGHLADNEQAAQIQQIQFWNRALYPFVCLVMVGLALPFAYLHPRSGGVSVKVFAGIMLGVSFVLLNNVFRHLGLLGNWTPWVVAATPGSCTSCFRSPRSAGWCAFAREPRMTQAIVLFAHGARDPRWAEPFEAVAARVRAAAPGCPVVLAFLELMTPSLGRRRRAPRRCRRDARRQSSALSRQRRPPAPRPAAARRRLARRAPGARDPPARGDRRAPGGGRGDGARRRRRRGLS